MPSGVQKIAALATRSSAGPSSHRQCRSGLRVFCNAEGVLAGEAKGLKLLSEIVSELD